MFHEDRDALEHVLDGLFHIAEADGLVHEDELEYLQVVGEIFGLTDEEFARLAARHVVLADTDPYFVLGVDPPNISDKELKLAYRKLVSEHHPDRLIAKGVPSDLVQVTSKKMASINSAYDAILDGRKEHQDGTLA